MAVDVGSAVGYLDLDISGFLAGLRTAQNEAETTVDNMNTKVSKGFKTAGSTLTSAGKTLTKGVTVPLAAAGALAIKTGIEFESAFAGVRKTIDASEEEFEELSAGIKEMSKVMPQSASEIAAVAEAAGQLGIKTENILGFTKTMVMLGDATNMSSEEAATALARFANITQMPQTEFDKLGSVIAALGNNLATTEREIADVGLNLAAAGSQVGMTEAQVLGFAGALSSVGIEAAAGGTAFSKVMVDMQLATELGGEKLNKFASIAGMSADQFKVKFKQDAAGALIDFIKGLQNTEEKGMSAIAVLDDMGITEARMRDALLRAAGAGDLFTDSIDLATNAWGENVALQAEAEQRYQTTESQLSMLKNRFNLIGITLAETLIPMLMKLADSLGKVADWFTSLNPKTQESIVKWGIFAAAVGPVLLGLGKLSTGIWNVIPMIGKMSTGFTKLGEGFALSKAGFPAMGAQASKLGAALGGVTTPILAIVAAIAVLIAAFATLWKTNEDFRNKMIAIWNQIKETVNGFLQGIVDRFNALGFDFKNIADMLWSIWKGFCDLLAPVFEGVFQQIANILDVVFDVILGILDIFIGIFTGNWEQVWEGIKGIFKGVWDFLIATFQNVVNVFTGILDTVCGWFGTTWENTWNAIKQFFVDIWNGIVSFFIGVLTGIQTFFQGIWEGITSFITTTLTTISTTFSNIWNSITSFLSSAWETIKNVVQVGIMFIVELISAAFQLITLPFRFIWENCKETIISIWDAISNTISKALTAIQNVITTVWNAVSTFFTTIWTSISTFISTVWGTIKNNITNTINTIKAIIGTVFNAIKTVITTVLTTISTTVSTIWNTIKTTISNIINSIKATIDSIWNTIKTTTITVWNAIKAAIAVPIDAAKHAISNVINSIKSIFSSGFNAVKSTVTSIFDSIKSKITSVMDSAKNIVSGAIDKIKSFFNFSWSLPKLKMPHFKISGEFSLNPPSVPKFGIEWYKKAMGGGMILDSPTIFGFNSKTGKLLAGGEAGSETVVGTKSLLNMIKTAVHESNVKIIQTITGYFDVILDNIKSSNEKLLYSIGYLVTASYQFAQACEDLSYVAYNGFVKSEQAIVESNKSKPVDEGGDTFIFNSPKPIDEIEAANQLKKAKRDLSEGF